MYSEPNPAPEAAKTRQSPYRRLLPLAVVAALLIVVYAMGWHRELSLETLIRHRAAIDGFILAHKLVAILAFIGFYVAVALATIVGATVGATILFLIAQSAAGEHLARRAGARVARFAAGFRADAFNYLLFLRLVPVPFWLVNLVPALLGVRLRTFVAATALGIIPATFIFAFFGAGLDSVIAAQEATYKTCLAAGGVDCRTNFEPASLLTPTLLAALIGLGLLALVPVLAKRIWWRQASAESQAKNS